MPLPYVSYFPDPTRIHRPDRMLYSDHKSLNSMGPTPTLTRTLGMRLSCKNVYTTVYHVQYTYTCTRAHPQRTSSRGKARVGQKSADFVGELNGPRAPGRPAAARAAAGRLPRAPRRPPRENPRAEVGEEVRVGVGVRVGPVEFKLNWSITKFHKVATRLRCGGLFTVHFTINLLVSVAAKEVVFHAKRTRCITVTKFK